MNPQEQRQRHTALAQLEADTVVVIDALYVKLQKEIRDAVKAEHVFRFESEKKILGLIAAQADMTKTLTGEVSAFQYQTFWQRVKWLVTGG